MRWPVFKRLLAALLLLAWPSGRISYAQDVIIKHFTVSNGLPSATVYAAKQDKQGFIWMATSAGVSRFDGRKFTNYSLTDGLAENEILTLAQDSKGRIWFLGLNGTLSYYKDGKFFNSGNDPLLKGIPHTNSFLNFFEDRTHKLWFSTLHSYTIIDSSNVYSLDETMGIPTSFFQICPVFNNLNDVVYIFDGSHYVDPDKKICFKSKFPIKNWNAFGYLPDGSLLFFLGNKLMLLKDTVQKQILFPDNRLKYARLNAVLLSSDGRLWTSAAGKGLYCYDYNDLSKPPKQYFPGMNIARLTEDREGNIWAGTVNDGVYMLQPWHGVARNYNSANGMESDDVFSVAKDNKGNIYAGMDKGKVCLINSGGIKTQQVNSNDLNSNHTTGILIKDDDVFLGSDNGIMHLNDAKKINCGLSFSYLKNGVTRMASVKNMCLYKNGLVACTSYSIFMDPSLLNNDCGKIILKKTDTQTIRRYCVFTDKNECLWYSMATGLFSYDGKVIVSHPEVDNFITEKIISISETPDSTIVLATYGQGVLFYKNGRIQARVTEKNGLAGNICKRVFVHKDDIYIATVNGVTCFKYSNGHIFSIRQFNTSNGLASNDVNDVYADDTDICIATSGGLTVLNAQASHQQAGAPPVYITGVVCNDTLQLADGSNLSYRENSLHFEFIGISYRSGNDVRYQYHLNAGQPWMGTNNTSLNFAYLPPGYYHFMLRARILNGQWSDAKSFRFTIRPPFWKTSPFIILAMLFCAGAIAVTVWYVLRRQHKKRNEELKIQGQVIELEQQALQAMMNPHFIFNVMNSIQHYINNNDRHEANLYLSDFARLIRMNLDISSKRYIPLDDEIEYLNLYLSLERLRFGERLTYEVSLDPAIDTDETMIPVMLLQPFIENALWHGILPLAGKGHVRLAITKQPGDMLKIEITDNGVGMAGAAAKDGGIKAHTSKGMAMTRQRLTLLGKISGHTLHLNIQDAFPGDKNKGTKIELLLPGSLA